MDRTWRSIILLWFIGVIAAAQLAKLSAPAPLLQIQFGLSLSQVGLLVSLIEIGGAVFGFVAGLALASIGNRRALLYGLAVLAVAATAEALAPDGCTLFLARAVEGLGYLLVVVSAPTMIAHAAGDGVRRAKAMALWSTFIPIGVGLGSGLTGWVVTAFGLRRAMLLWAAIIIIIALVGSARLERTPIVQRRITIPPAAAWLLTAGFGCYTLFLCALIGLLPSFLVARHRASLGTASMIAGVVSIAAVPGAFIALRAMRGGDTSARRSLGMAAFALLAGAALAPFVYRLGDLASSVGLAALTLILSGIARTLLFTRVPVLSGAKEAGDPRIAAANGLLAQFGAAGALLGPPLGGLVIEHWGWSGFGVVIGLLMLALLVLFTAAEWIGYRVRRVSLSLQD